MTGRAARASVRGRPRDRPDGRALGAACLAGVFLVALAVRLAPLPGLVRPDGAYRLGPDGDPYEHARRVVETLRDFPRVPFEDPEADWPRGGRNYWPPLPDLLAATAARLLGIGPGDRSALTRLLALAPVPLGLAGVLAAYGGGRRLGLPPAWSALGAAFLAAAPEHAVQTMAGSFGHEAVEALCVAGLFAAHLVAPPAGTALAAASLVLLSLSWQGAWVHGVLVAAAAAAGRLATGDRAYARRGAVALLAAAFATAPICLLGPWGREGAFAYDALSLFQPALALSLLAGLAVLSGAPAGGRLRGATFFLGAVVATYLALVAAGGASPVAPLRGGAAWVLSRDPFLSAVSESRPLFGETRYATMGVGLLLIAAPLGAALAGRPDALFWAAALFAAAATKRRFTIQYLPVAAPLAALLLHEILRRAPRRRAAVAVALLLAAGAALWPTRRALAGLAVPRGTEIEAAAALLAATAVAAGEGDRRGAFVEWAWGHHLRWYAGLPVVADPMGRGFEAERRLRAARSDSEVLAVLDERRVRWVVLPSSVRLGRAAASRLREVAGSPAGTFRVIEVLPPPSP